MLITGMADTKRAKILGEFKTAEETKKIDDVLRLIRNGTPQGPEADRAKQQNPTAPRSRSVVNRNQRQPNRPPAMSRLNLDYRATFLSLEVPAQRLPPTGPETALLDSFERLLQSAQAGVHGNSTDPIPPRADDSRSAPSPSDPSIAPDPQDRATAPSEEASPSSPPPSPDPRTEEKDRRPDNADNTDDTDNADDSHDLSNQPLTDAAAAPPSPSTAPPADSPTASAEKPVEAAPVDDPAASHRKATKKAAPRNARAAAEPSDSTAVDAAAHESSAAEQPHGESAPSRTAKTVKPAAQQPDSPPSSPPSAESNPAIAEHAASLPAGTEPEPANQSAAAVSALADAQAAVQGQRAAAPAAPSVDQVKAAAAEETTAATSSARRTTSRTASRSAASQHATAETADEQANAPSSDSQPQAAPPPSELAPPPPVAAIPEVRDEASDAGRSRPSAETLRAEPSTRTSETSTSGTARADGRQSTASDQADRVRFVQRVTRAFEAAAERDGPIRLRLAPPELGSLRLELSIRQGAVTARLEAETDTARQMLLDNLPALRKRLADHNLRVERFEVALAGQSGGNLPQQPGDQSRWQGPAPYSPAQALRARQAASAAPAATVPRSPHSESPTGFDVTI